MSTTTDEEEEEKVKFALKLNADGITTDATKPSRGSEYAAGWDLSASLPTVIQPHQQHPVETNVYVQLPPNTYGRIG